MAAFSDYLELQLLNHSLRNTPLTAPAAVYLGLFTADVTDAGTGPEVTDSGYARKAVTFAAPAVVGTTHSCANAATVEFNAIVQAAVTVSHFGIYDAATGGNLLYHGVFGSSRTLQIDDVPTVAAGAVSVSLS